MHGIVELPQPLDIIVLLILAPLRRKLLHPRVGFTVVCDYAAPQNVISNDQPSLTENTRRRAGLRALENLLKVLEVAGLLSVDKYEIIRLLRLKRR